MKLIVTRHAKSSWDYPNLSDHERPLAKRGRRGADAIGKWLAEQQHIPQTVLCSTSKRTRETWSRMSKILPTVEDVRFEPDLYHGGVQATLSVLSTARSSTVIILGHNSGIGFFADAILTTPPEHQDFFRYPTAATLVCEVPVNDWAEVQYESGILIDFVVPRELE